MKQRLAVAVLILTSFVLASVVEASRPAAPSAPAAPGKEEFLQSLQSEDSTSVPASNACFGQCLQDYYWPCVAACGDDQDCLALNCDWLIDSCRCSCGGWCY